MKNFKDDMMKLFWTKCIEYTNANTPDPENTWLGISSAYKAGSKAVIDYIDDNYDICDRKAPKDIEYCNCETPDRESGFSYCMHCNKSISDARMIFLIDKDEISKEPAKEPNLEEIQRRKLRKEHDDINFNNLCARATLYPGKSIEEIKVIQMGEKIERVYKEMNDSLLHTMPFNEPKTREWVVSTLRQAFGNLTAVKCDDENNPPDVVDQCILIAKVIWNTDYCNEYGYKYVIMIFGNPDAVEKYQHQQYFDNEQYKFIQKGI